jgi:hypothetical protein
MTILYDATRPVKPTRRFGAGLLAYAPNHRNPYTVADEAEYLQDLADRDQAVRDFDQHLEERALMSLARDRAERGLLF